MAPGHELAGEVQRYDLVGGADEPAADEEGGDGRRASSRSISRPRGSLSSSCTAAHTPSSERRLVTVWHIGHWLVVKITAAFSVDSLDTLSAIGHWHDSLSSWISSEQ